MQAAARPPDGNKFFNVEKNFPVRAAKRSGGFSKALRVKCRLPMAHWHLTCNAATARVLTIMTRQCSLLFIEDDLAVRESITRVLEAEGYQVSSAASCPDAIHELDRRPVDMVLLDLNLGKEEGWRAFHALKERRPSLPIIVTSGRADELRHSSVKRASGALEKPFDMPVLLTILKQASPTASFHVSLGPPSDNALTPIRTGRFSDNLSASIPKPVQEAEGARSAQAIEQQQITSLSYDGMSPATALMKK